MRIGLDGRLLIRQLRGMALHINNTLHEILKVDPQNEYRLYIHENFAYNVVPEEYTPVLDALKKYPNLSVVNIDAPNAFQWEQRYLPNRLKSENLDILHMPANRAPFRCPARKLIVTVHDMIEIIFFDHFFRGLSGLRGRFYEYRVELYIKFMYKYIFPRADLIFTVSESSRQDIHRIIGVPLSKIKVCCNAHNPLFKYLDLSRKKYLLTFGKGAKHKNSDSVLKAFAMLPDDLKEHYQLLIVGKTPSLEHLAAELDEKNIIFTDADDQTLLELYNKALGFVFVSFYEGFGIPALEAMVCGTPVIASTTSSVPEIVGDAGLLVNPKDITQIRDAMQKILTDEKLRAKLSKAGLKRAELFSWKKNADMHLEVYKQCAQ